MNMVNVFDQLAPIAQIVRKCPTPTLANAFVDACREFAGKSHYLKVDVFGETVADQYKYELGNDPDLDIIGIAGMTGSQNPGNGIQYWPIVPGDPSTWDPNLQVNPSTTMPVRYAYVPEAQFLLNPIPKQVYSLSVSVIVQPKEGATRVPQQLLTKYRSEIEAGALAYLRAIPGQPWTDQIAAASKDREFRSGISNAKADAQRAYNTGSVRARPRQFLR